MDKKVRWTDEAFEWLQKVYDYIALDNEVAAKNLVQSILKKTSLLEKFPEMGLNLDDYPTRNIKTLLYGHYRIVYLIKDNLQIDILGVFHGALDLKKYLELSSDE